MRGLIRVQVIAAAGAILFARSVVADDWPYYQHDALHTGDSSALVTPQLLSLVWTAPSSPTGYSTPVIVGNTIYAMQNQQGFGELHTTVSSFDLSTGAINWSYTGNFLFPSQPGVGGGFVTFVGSTVSSSSLYVLDAITGTLRYTVPIPEGPTSLMPTVVQDPITGNVTAFVAGYPHVSAVSLGPVSGSVLWTQVGDFCCNSIPTVVGSSIVLVGPGQYYAFDQATGAVNHFFQGNGSGGGGSTVAYDAARQQFYVQEFYSVPAVTVSAYHYTDNAHITLLWQRTDVAYVGSVAIGPNGNVYTAGNGTIWELDPATGATLRSAPALFANGVTPALTNNVLWIIGESQTFAYDLVTLQLLRAFPGSRGNLNTAYDSPGAFADGYFVLDYGNIVGGHSFDVYHGPTPTPTPTPTASPTPTPCVGQYVIANGTDAIVPGTLDIGSHCDDCMTTISLPFPFTLYNQVYTAVNLDSNGNAQFATNTTSYQPFCLPSPGHDFTIFPLWTDLETVQLTTGTGCSTFPTGNCGIFTSTTGTAPNRQFHIEWRVTMFGAGNNHYDYELRLFESNSTFEIIYGNMFVASHGNQLQVAGVQRSSGGGFFTQDFCLASTGIPPQNVSRTYTLPPCVSPTPTPTPTPTPIASPTPRPRPSYPPRATPPPRPTL